MLEKYEVMLEEAKKEYNKNMQEYTLEGASFFDGQIYILEQIIKDLEKDRK